MGGAWWGSETHQHVLEQADYSLGHDGHSLGANYAQIGVIKDAYTEVFGGFLKGKDCRALKLEISFEVMCKFTREFLKAELIMSGSVDF